MYVVPAARRRGHARRLLSALEEDARRIGLRRVRLDTNAQQPEAVALYHACGYAEIADYNGSPTATHWFEKELNRGRLSGADRRGWQGRRAKE